LKDEEDVREVYRTVAEVLATDVGRGLARLSQGDMAHLRLIQGEPVKMVSSDGREAFAKAFCMRSEDEERDPFSVQVDGMTRASLQVELGQKVGLMKARKPLLAEKLVLRPLADGLSDFPDEGWSRIALEDKPVWSGAKILIPYRGHGAAFVVSSVEPQHEDAPLIATMRTEIRIERAAQNEDFERESVDLYVDGLAEPKNPGTGTYGFVAYKDGTKIAEGSGLAGESVTNNFAEYEALIQGLIAVREYSATKVKVLSDSQLLVNQMLGKWKVKKGAYAERHLEARKLAKGFKSLDFVWIPREMNREADELTRKAYDKYSRGLG